MNTDRKTTLKSSKLATPLSLIMLSSEKLKSTILPVNKASFSNFHKKNASLPIRPCEFSIKGARSAKSCKKDHSNFLYFSRIVDPGSRLKSAKPATRRRILNNTYTKYFKANKKTPEIFQNERIRNGSYFDYFPGPPQRVSERQLVIMLNSVLGKPANPGHFNEEKKN